MNQELLNKLKKLINLSKSANEHEADLALQKATEMAVSAGIDLAVVAAKDTTTEQEKLEMVKDYIDVGRRVPTTQKYASWLLDEHFNVKLVYSGGRYGGRSIVFLGDKRDVEFAKFVNEFVQEEMQRRWDYYKKTNSLSVRFKATFLYNCYKGFNAKLKEAKQNTETVRFSELPQESRQQTEQKYALVVADKKQAVTSFLHTQYPSLRKIAIGRTNFFASGSVASDGFASGQTMKINRPLTC